MWGERFDRFSATLPPFDFRLCFQSAFGPISDRSVLTRSRCISARNGNSRQTALRDARAVFHQRLLSVVMSDDFQLDSIVMTVTHCDCEPDVLQQVTVDG